ncbi:DNA mismatch endonuclease Vsr [Treponema denticola]|uniref:DNA mismatch endonuclease Vsr n=1 Tax=Treponema denticola TaxID=158 RepID=UPI0020A4A225|nr:DNA mismatch endonuclease Vsr [Treponema denticola]
MDKLTKEQRRKNMQANKASGTKPELLLEEAMLSEGLLFIKNDKSVFGKPDFVFTNLKLAVFVDGEFWHGKDWLTKKLDHKTNQEFWIKKIERNIERDKEVNEYLKKEGWKILRFWAKDIEQKLPTCIYKIKKVIGGLKMELKDKLDLTSFIGTKFKNESEEEQNMKAVVTHYLLNEHMENNELYKSEAVKFTQKAMTYSYPDKETDSEAAEKALQYGIFDSLDVPFPPPNNPKFTFIDLFAGIGGFRIAFQSLGGKCVFTSEWDNEAKKTYLANFGELPFGDITKDTTKLYIPEHFDILCAGFPCQAFSIAGKRGGFEDTRGTLFFEVADILKQKQPKAFFLENVKGLRNHNKGKTLETILNVLRNDLGYFVPEPQIINAKDFGLPQNRERIFIVGFHPCTKITKFAYPKPINKDTKFLDVKEKNVVPTKYYLSTQYLKTLKEHKERHKNKGNGFGYEIIDDNGITNAIMVGGMGRERNLVLDDRITDFKPMTNIKGEVNREGIRKMTPREWARLQGFPDEFIIPVSDASAYKQFGNSVAIPAIKATAKKILKEIKEYENGETKGK